LYSIIVSLKTVTARLSPKTLEEIEEIAKREKIDRSELIRRLLDSALNQRRIDEAIEAYRKGRITLWKASEIAGVTLREMMEIASERKVLIPYTLKDLERDMEYARRENSNL